MESRKFHLLILCISLFVCVATVTYYFVHKANTKNLAHPSQQYSETNPSTSLVKQAETPEVSGEPKQKLNVNKGPSEKIREDFVTAKNYAVFISEALKRPGEGGRFYAHHAYWRCLQILPLQIDVQIKNKNSGSEQQAAIQNIKEKQSRCKGVQELYPDAVAFTRMLMDERGERDPTLSLYNRIKLQDAPQSLAHADLQRAVAGGDKHDIQFAMTAGKNVFINEALRELSTKPSEDLVENAFEVATCQVAATCADIIPLIGSCALKGNCKYSDWAELVRTEYSGKELELFDQLHARFLKLTSL